MALRTCPECSIRKNVMGNGVCRACNSRLGQRNCRTCKAFFRESAGLKTVCGACSMTTGRPRKVSQEEALWAQLLRADGFSLSEIGIALKAPRSTVRDALHRVTLPP